MLNRRILASVVVALATTITTLSFAQGRGMGEIPAAGAKAGDIKEWVQCFVFRIFVCSHRILT
jgi:hypothetical protein